MHFAIASGTSRQWQRPFGLSICPSLLRAESEVCDPPVRNMTNTNIGAVGTVLSPIDQNNRSEVINSIRQVSNGNVWGVGGVAPGGTAVDNGHGQFLRSGTNARLFRTSFPTARPKAQDELEKLEARLAEALGLDRTRRIIETSIPRYRGENSRGNSRG